jgi:hypothetical protein
MDGLSLSGLIVDGRSGVSCPRADCTLDRHYGRGRLNRRTWTQDPRPHYSCHLKAQYDVRLIHTYMVRPGKRGSVLTASQRGRARNAGKTMLGVLSRSPHGFVANADRGKSIPTSRQRECSGSLPSHPPARRNTCAGAAGDRVSRNFCGSVAQNVRAGRTTVTFVMLTGNHNDVPSARPRSRTTTARKGVKHSRDGIRRFVHSPLSARSIRQTRCSPRAFAEKRNETEAAQFPYAPLSIGIK